MLPPELLATGPRPGPTLDVPPGLTREERAERERDFFRRVSERRALKLRELETELDRLQSETQSRIGALVSRPERERRNSRRIHWLGQRAHTVRVERVHVRREDGTVQPRSRYVLRYQRADGSWGEAWHLSYHEAIDLARFQEGDAFTAPGTPPVLLPGDAPATDPDGPPPDDSPYRSTTDRSPEDDACSAR